MWLSWQQQVRPGKWVGSVPLSHVLSSHTTSDTLIYGPLIAWVHFSNRKVNVRISRSPLAPPMEWQHPLASCVPLAIFFPARATSSVCTHLYSMYTHHHYVSTCMCMLCWSFLTNVFFKYTWFVWTWEYFLHSASRRGLLLTLLS